MLYGCCVNLLPGSERLAGLDYAPALAEMGYDYIELPLRRLTELAQEAFRSAAERLRRTGLPCRCCNDFLPAAYQLVGEDRTPERELDAYLSAAFGRMEALGTPYAVFGSPWSRSCPPDFDPGRAWEQLCVFLRRVGGMAADHGITVAIEHNNHTETNMINRFSAAAAMAQEVDHPNIRLMCDYYHLRVEGEDPRELLPWGSRLVHTHIARLEGRRYFDALEGEELHIHPYARVLNEIGYQGGISVEGRISEGGLWQEQGRQNLLLLRRVCDSPSETCGG